MLARGIERMYTIEIGEEKINPYNRYWTKSIVDPFLILQNCIGLGVSPSYHFNWFTKQKKEYTSTIIKRIKNTTTLQ
jgi:hypothetical protein